jgi:phosphoglycolate phosphatase-like HAD superfamily hydrolase
MRQLGVKNTACLYVGNADEDVETAKNAKVFDVLVDRGEHTYPDINPSLRIKSLYELKYLLELSPK